ncbi:MAG: hypothetical protein ABWY36_07985 [Leifsonia sp.]
MTGGSDAPLLISGDGSTAVSTDELYAHSRRLVTTAAAADDWTAAIASAAWAGGVPGAAELDDARRRASAIGEKARGLASALERSAEAYGLLESLAARTQEVAAGVLGWMAGLFSPVLAAGAVAVAIDASLAFFAVIGVRRMLGLPTEIDVAALARQHRRVVNNPMTVAAVRLLVSSVDDAAAGAAHLPPQVSRALDDVGITGVRSSAFGAVVLGGLFGVLREGPVRVRQTDARGEAVATTSRRGADTGAIAGSPVAAPSGIEDLLSRVPPPSDDDPQVRVERFGDDWVVYIGGTIGWELSGSTEPWDLTSNVQAMAGGDPASYRAVQDALHQAGVRPGDPVLAVGHSQGGMLAALLAQDPDISCTGLVTAGAPIAGVELPPDVPLLQLEHTDDIVPALAGMERTDYADGQLLVRREFLAAGSDDGRSVVPAHELAGYRQTAALVDSSPDPRLQAFRAQLDEFTGKASGTATWWRGVRD